MKFKEYITEIFDTVGKADYTTVRKNEFEHEYTFTINDTKYVVDFTFVGKGEWVFEFGNFGKGKSEFMVNYELTDFGNATQVFSTVATIVIDFVKKMKPRIIGFSAAKKGKDKNRARVYKLIAQKLLSRVKGYELVDNIAGDENVHTFDIVKEDK